MSRTADWQRFLEDADPQQLLKACIRLRELGHPGLKLGSDQLTYREPMRSTLLQAIRKEWCRGGPGREMRDFPWEEGMVLHMWVSSRKTQLTLGDVDEYCTAITVGA